VRRHRTALLDSLLLLALTVALIWPLFRLEYLDNWPSIESTFIADARMLLTHLPHPGWQPLWYCGTRFDYIYPPALRYGTALLSLLGGVSTARGYHLYIAVYYVLGIVSVYWLVRLGSACRKSAWVASLATALLSPSFLFMTALRHDSPWLVPQRLHVLMSYGEGPHMSALAVLPAALAACFLALRRWNPAAFIAASALCALAVANNFYGATALAIFFPILAWSVWTADRDWLVALRALAIPALAYGFSAFWLTPDYLRITLLNLKWVSQPGNSWSVLIWVFVAAIFCATSFRLGYRQPARTWTLFVLGAAALLTVDVAGFYFFGFRIIGEAQRLVPELDLILILAAVEGLRALWNRPAWRIPVLVILVLAFAPATRYIRHAWSPFPVSPPAETRYEFRIARWVHNHLPGQRVLPQGTVRFWFDAWHDNAQPDGGSLQGMLNQNLPDATWQILHGDRADLAILWLRALGTDAVIVPDKTSLETYHDYQFPEKFRGAVPALFDDGHGTVIYGIPRAYTGLGRVVDQHALNAVGRIRGGDDAAGLTRYLDVLDKPGQSPTTITWHGTDEVELRATANEGQAVFFQETWDPAWHAYQNGRELSVKADPTMGFMTIPVSPGPQQITLKFETPIENRVGQGLFILSLLLAAALFRVRPGYSLSPALSSSSPGT
jgi:hypothetical protein